MNKQDYDGLTFNQLAERNAEHVTAIARLEAQVKQLAAERDAVVAENIGMDSFVESMLAIAWQGGSADGSDIQELALKCGLIRQEVYCADKHENLVDDPGNFEDGDALYFRLETPATEAYAASLRAEGVEMLANDISGNAMKSERGSTAFALLLAQAEYAKEFAAQLRSKSEVHHD